MRVIFSTKPSASIATLAIALLGSVSAEAERPAPAALKQPEPPSPAAFKPRSPKDLRWVEATLAQMQRDEPSSRLVALFGRSRTPPVRNADLNRVPFVAAQPVSKAA